MTDLNVDYSKEIEKKIWNVLRDCQRILREIYLNCNSVSESSKQAEDIFNEIEPLIDIMLSNKDWNYERHKYTEPLQEAFEFIEMNQNKVISFANDDIKEVMSELEDLLTELETIDDTPQYSEDDDLLRATFNKFGEVFSNKK